MEGGSTNEKNRPASRLSPPRAAGAHTHREQRRGGNVSVQQIHPEVETQPTDPSTMRVPQGVLVAAADLGGDNFRRIDPAVVTRGVFPIAEDIEHWKIVP